MSSRRNQWLAYAIASGGCAALNGVFAKLTTTGLTTTWATSISHVFGLDESSVAVDYIVRSLFFLLNLAFNGVMWGLFTQALTLASSTVRVSVINTSANFMLTAVMGAIVFKEDLPGLWWLGASMLVVGSVIIGRREEGKNLESSGPSRNEHPVAGQDGSKDQTDVSLISAEGKSNDFEVGYGKRVELRRKSNR